MEQHERQCGAAATATAVDDSKTIDEHVPDPDEGDLDDLDDMLDEFSSTKLHGPEQAALDVGSDHTGQAQGVSEPESSAEGFGRQLQEQMAALIGSMDESPEMKRDIEAMMKELAETADPDATINSPSEAQKGAKPVNLSPGVEEPFQQTIRKTMQRMKASGEQATAAVRSSDPEDILSQLMKEMQSGGLDGANGDESFNKMLMGMMEQLTNKEILYEPMKELHDKYPAWLETNRAVVATDDLQRFEQQQRLVKDIVDRFEKKQYSDNDASDREYIVDRMQQMQAAGSPPADLVGDMNVAHEALGDMNAGCTQQ